MNPPDLGSSVAGSPEAREASAPAKVWRALKGWLASARRWLDPAYYGDSIVVYRVDEVTGRELLPHERERDRDRRPGSPISSF